MGGEVKNVPGLKC